MPLARSIRPVGLFRTKRDIFGTKVLDSYQSPSQALSVEM